MHPVPARHSPPLSAAVVCLAVLLVVLAARPGVSQSSFGPVFNPSNGHCYEVVLPRDPILWPDARAAAQSRTYLGHSGYLATLTSAAETQFILTNLPSAVGNQALIGGRQAPGSAEPGAGWGWITGEPWSYTNWGTGQPDNTAGGRNENVIILIAGGVWNDYPDSLTRNSYVVEYGDSPFPPPPVAFQRPQIYEVPDAYDLTAGDLDGDGFLDLVSPARGSLAILYGQADGSFEQAQFLNVPDTAGRWIWTDTGIADVNRDGRNDLVATHPDGSVVLVYRNEGGRTLSRATRYPAGEYPHAMVIRDFNKDGWPDLALTHHSPGLFTYLQNRGDGTFAAPKSQGMPNFMGKICSADLNGDTHPDVALAGILPGMVFVFFGNGAGGFTAGASYRAGSTSGYTRAIVSADFNGDRKPDLVVANTSDQRV